MENFDINLITNFDWNIILTYSGLMGIVLILVQFLKTKIINIIPVTEKKRRIILILLTWGITLGLICVALTILDKWDDKNIALQTLVNSIIITLSTTGGFEYLKSFLSPKSD